MVDTVQEYVFLSFFYKTTCILSIRNKREKKNEIIVFNGYNPTLTK